MFSSPYSVLGSGTATRSGGRWKAARKCQFSGPWDLHWVVLGLSCESCAIMRIREGMFSRYWAGEFGHGKTDLIRWQLVDCHRL